jgi:nucleotide-binding universal stress UspA family protein
MNIPRRILMGTDFSDYSKEAYDYAVLLAKQFGADLFLLHALEMPAFFVPGVGRAAGPDVVEWIRALKEEEQKKLQPLEAEAHQKGVKVQSILKEGSPVQEILKAAEEVRAELIVLGTHGRTGLDRFMMGSVAERVSRQALCPIMLVRPKAFSGKGLKGN